MNAENKNSPTILIADDEPDICEVISYAMEGNGYSTCAVHDAEAAIKTVQSRDIDLVISDVRMPKGGGMKLLKEIKNYNPDKPKVILLTGYNSDGTSDDAIKAGASAVLSKPIKLSDLVKAVNSILGQTPAKPTPGA